MSTAPEWVDCDCQEPVEHCSCGEPHPVTREQLIHWREQHWAVRCALNMLLEENDEMRRRLVKMAVDKIFQRRRNLLQDFSQLDEE